MDNLFVRGDINLNNCYDYIAHYGVRGMKKGKRRWTNLDGSLNEEGKRRYKLNRNYAPVSPKVDLPLYVKERNGGQKPYVFNTSNHTYGYDERKKREASAKESRSLTKTTNVAANYEENLRTMKGYTEKDRVKTSKEYRKASYAVFKARKKGMDFVSSFLGKVHRSTNKSKYKR